MDKIINIVIDFYVFELSVTHVLAKLMRYFNVLSLYDLI